MQLKGDYWWFVGPYFLKNYIEFSLYQLHQISQIELYSNEYSDLLQGKKVFSLSRVLNLKPTFKKNLIKRLHSAEISVKNKHEIVVSKTHSIATLIIQEIHQGNIHIRRTLYQYLEKDIGYHLEARIIRKLINDYLCCKRQNAKQDHPFMGDLQSNRTKMRNILFSIVGVDYFRQIIVKLSNRTRSILVQFI